MKYKIYIITTIIIVCAGMLIWSQNQSSNQIKVGFVGPFSGSAASFGEFMQRGLDLAKTNITMVKEDDVCTGKDAVSAVKKLIEVDKVNYVIGPLCNDASLATEKLFEDNKIISITVGLPSEKIANMGPYHFSFSPEIGNLMKTLADEVARQALKRVAVIHINSSLENENYSQFKKHISQNRVEIVADITVEKGTTDFRSILLQIKQTKPDSLMLIAYREGEINNILKQLNELGLSNLQKFGIHAVQIPSLLQVKDVAEGLIYPYPADRTESISAKTYVDAYNMKYGSTPDFYSVNVYDAVNILTLAIQKCGYANKDCVREELANLRDYQGANGNLSVDERGVGVYKEIMLKVVRNGKFEKLTSY